MSRYSDEKNPLSNQLEDFDCTYDEFEAARMGYLTAEKEYALTEEERDQMRGVFYIAKKAMDTDGIVILNAIKKKVLGE